MKKVTAEVIEKNRYLVTVEVEDNATDGDIYDAIVRAYIGDDTYMGDSCKVIEQYIYDVTNTLDDKTCSLLVQALKYADLHIIELPVDVIKSKESLLSDIRFFIKEFTSRMSEEE